MIDPLDIRVVRFWGRLVRTAVWLVLEPEQWYGPVRSFLLTVGGGWVSRATASSRREFCDHSGPSGWHCPSRRTTGGIDYCTGQDSGCGGKCPKAWWWPFGWLRFRQRLKRWGCPRGHWQPEWSWLDAARRGTVRVVAGAARRIVPGWRARRRALKSRSGRRGCDRARVTVV